jgi:phosphoglycerate dehydrogenase-like enzyme
MGARRLRVLLSWYATKEEIRDIKRALPSGTEVAAPPERPHLSRFEVPFDELKTLAARADAIMGWVLPAGILELAARLKVLIWLHAGCDELDLKLLKKRKVKVANARGGNAIAVAEHAFALMLALAKRLIVKHRAVIEARWTPGWDPQYQSLLLEGKTLTIVGLGQIGTAVARRAKAFDMRVLGVRRHVEKGGTDVDRVFAPRDLHRALKAADFVLLALPIVQDTVGMLDAKGFAVMKSGACLINVARGNLIQEAPLHAALTSGRLTGYAADVWWNYTNAFPATYHFPIPSRTGIQHLPNVIATGNQASHTSETRATLLGMGTESLAAFMRRKPMPRQIDLDLGY